MPPLAWSRFEPAHDVGVTPGCCPPFLGGGGWRRKGAGPYEGNKKADFPSDKGVLGLAPHITIRFNGPRPVRGHMH